MTKKLSRKQPKLSKQAQKTRQNIIVVVVIAVVVIAMAFVVKYLQSSNQSSYVDADAGTKVVQIETYSHIANGSCWRFATANPNGEKLWNCTNGQCTTADAKKCVTSSAVASKSVAEPTSMPDPDCIGNSHVTVYTGLGKNQIEKGIGSTSSSGSTTAFCTAKPGSEYCRVTGLNSTPVSCNAGMTNIFYGNGLPDGVIEMGRQAGMKGSITKDTYCSVVQSDAPDAWLVMWIDADGNYCWNGQDTEKYFDGCNLGARPGTSEGGFETYYPKLNWKDCATQPTPTPLKPTLTPPKVPTSIPSPTVTKKPTPTITKAPTPTPVAGACTWKGMENSLAQFRKHSTQNGQIVVTEQVRPVIERSFTIDRTQTVKFEYTMDQIRVDPSDTRASGSCPGQPNEEAFVEVYKKLGGGVLQLMPHIYNPTKFADNVEADRNSIVKTLELKNLEPGSYLIRSTWAGDGRNDPTAPPNTVSGGAAYYTNFSQDAGEPSKLKYPDKALDRVCQWDGSYKIKLRYCTI